MNQTLVTWKLAILWLTCQASGAGTMEADDHQVATVFTVQPSFHHQHSTNRVSWSVTIAGEVQSHLTSSLADDGNDSWYSVYRVPMVDWRLDCENCHHLTVISLHDTGPWCSSISAHTGWRRTSVLWLDVIVCLICNFFLRVAHKIVLADLFVWSATSISVWLHIQLS